MRTTADEVRELRETNILHPLAVRVCDDWLAMESVVSVAREMIDPWRRDDGWKATEWQDRLEEAVVNLDREGKNDSP